MATPNSRVIELLDAASSRADSTGAGFSASPVEKAITAQLFQIELTRAFPRIMSPENASLRESFTLMLRVLAPEMFVAPGGDKSKIPFNVAFGMLKSDLDDVRKGAL